MQTRFPIRLRPALLLCAALALGGCAGSPPETASMMRNPGYGAGGLNGVRAVDRAPRLVNIIAVTPEVLAREGGATGDAGGGWAYRLGVGDVMQIFAVDAPELTLDAGYRVEMDGAILVPFLGRVPVDGRTTEEVRADLTQRLRPYFSAPQVEVRVTGFNARSVAVVGDVQRPSRQPITDRPLTAIDAINAAGGFAGDPERARVTLIRGGREMAVDVRAFLESGAPTPVLQDGDVLRVGGRIGWGAPEAPARATARLLRPDGRLQSIDLVAGPVSVAQVVPALGMIPGGAVYVLRASATGIDAYQLDAAAAVNPAIGGMFRLRAGDLVTADPAPSVDPEQQVSRLTPALRAMARPQA
ncbi:polysaccharide biosynthesis/export family protein [Pararhodobacter sp.]